MAWLNGLPEVKRLVESEFGGREITEQNVSDWRSNGYLHWQAQQEALALAKELSAGGEAPVSGGALSDSLARLVTARYALLLHDWNGEMTDEFRVKLRGLEGLSREIVRLRRSDQLLERVKIEREWLELDEQRYMDEKRKEEEKAMQFCLDGTLEYPEAQKAFRDAFDVLKKSMGDE